MSRFVWVRTFAVVTVIFALIYLGFMVAMPQPTFATAPSCQNLLQNSDMEGGGGWIFGLTPAIGYYSTAQYASPSRSAHLGITTGPNVNSYSSLRQIVSIPVATPGQTAQLRLQVMPITQPFDPSDGQEILIMDVTGMTTLRTLWSTTSNAGVWQPLSFDVSDFMGQTIMVYINVYNNGVGGRTAMYVDDVYLEVCGGAATATATPGFVTATPTSGFVTATPTPGFITATPTAGFVTATPTFIVVTNTPTPTITPNFVTATPTPIVVTNTPTQSPGFITATPTMGFATSTPTAIPALPSSTPTPTGTPIPPGACIEMLLNTSFENWQGWYFGKTVLQPGYVTNNPHTGYRSALLGNAYYDRPNYNSYSSVRQRVSLPRGPGITAYLDFWRFTASDLEPDDYQELVILDARGKTLAVLWRQNLSERQWQYQQFDMTRFLGKSIYVYLNVRNRGNLGRASMYVDDVSLKLCSYATTSGADQQPLLALTPTSSPATVPEAIFATTTPTAVATTAQVQPEFATAAPASPASPSVTASLESPSAAATGETGQTAADTTPVTLPESVAAAPTSTPEILATPTPLGADKVIPEKTTSNIWQIVRQALVYAAVIIGLLILAFLAYRIIMGRRKQKGT